MQKQYRIYLSFQVNIANIQYRTTSAREGALPPWIYLPNLKYVTPRSLQGDLKRMPNCNENTTCFKLQQLSHCVSVYSNSRPDQGAYTAVCRAYCDKNGHPRGGQLCQSYSRQVYCCGDLSTRYCCTRPEDAIQSQPEDVTTCPRSGGWWENK